MNKDSSILVTGANGMVGKYLQDALRNEGYTNVNLAIREEYDLRDPCDAKNLFFLTNPEYVFHVAAKVGGIMWNKTCPADFIRDNILMNTNVIEAARKYKTKKLLFCGSAGVYPKDCLQPMKEEYIMTGKFEEVSQYYGFSKLAGILMCQAYRKQYGCNFISCLPTNLYGMYDKFDIVKSHAVPSIIRKFYEANRGESIVINGTGESKREFLYAGDLANAMIFLMNCYDSPDPINIGGTNLSIKELIEIVKNVSGYEKNVVWNTDFPEGIKERCLDSSKIKMLGWEQKTSIEEGLKITYDWYVRNNNI